ncbi:DASH family cryptochrome [Mesonia ostreae]|uniref:Cryptochrome DASH n=1 Tax=Mesonia ostreae TaxID=861110 RepID=A0ABU2KES2_9FLAO|nr:DASH family cryptochrome [Mesonia ostreae]MDT0293200.1 DASH family cryptochrome [Mesonia ostreae]
MKTGLIWFRNDLRTRDQLSLYKAQQECDKLIAVYFFNPNHYELTNYGFKKTEKFRAQFLIETVENLRENLKKLHISLLVFKEQPHEVIDKLIQEFSIEDIFYQEEWTSEEVLEVKKVKDSVSNNVAFNSSYDQFLIEPPALPYSDFEKIPEVFTRFRKKLEKDWQVSSCTPQIKAFPYGNLIQQTTAIPTLEELGLLSFEKDSRSAFPFKGGEEEALNRLFNYVWETDRIAVYKKTRNGLLGKDYSSKLSAWLANGSISAKAIYWEVKKYEKERTKNQSTYWLIFELLWRDYFKYISLKHGASIFKLQGISSKNLEWNQDKEAFERWKNGTTQNSFINANMLEIRKTGFMSNRGRQNVNSYWAKELYQDWRIGAAYFESMLVDYDVHSNWGNWMYNSGVGNDPRDRKFHIKSQAERYDPRGKYQQTWLQEKLF